MFYVLSALLLGGMAFTVWLTIKARKAGRDAQQLQSMKEDRDARDKAMAVSGRIRRDSPDDIISRLRDKWSRK